MSETVDGSLALRQSRVLLICHHDEPLNREGLARWLAASAMLVGIVNLRENRQRLRNRVRREVRRVGWLRFIDVVAFRFFYKLFLHKHAAEWEQRKLEQLAQAFPEVPATVPILESSSPNTVEVEEFIRRQQPDIMIARCKTLLKPNIFSIPRAGTFAMHPGICPQYRNAHGCFWALARGDVDHVGMTLLKIDSGVDTGPVYGHYFSRFDEPVHSHLTIQDKVVFDHLNSLQGKLGEIHSGTARPVLTNDRPSAVWGQPWITAYPRFRSECSRLSREELQLRAAPTTDVPTEVVCPTRSV